MTDISATTLTFAAPRRSWLGADPVLRVLTALAALCILAMIGVLVGVLCWSSIPSIKAFGLSFLYSTEWRPNEREVPKRGPDGKVIIEDGETVMETLPASFGAAAVIYGTATSSAIAILFAVPLSFGASLFLVRIAPKVLVAPVSFLIELLAAIPSIAYGMWGLFVLAPWLQRRETWLFDRFSSVSWLSWLFAGVSPAGRDMLCGGLILGIMILPIITAISRDVLRTVPRAQLEGAVALGATWWQSSREMLKFARSALFGAVMLGLARAAGETMAVAMVIGNNPQIAPSPFAPAQTMSSLLANGYAEASAGVHVAALSEVALILLVMSLGFNIIARYLIVGRGGSRVSAAH
jgi:phosphate transport system permease protein